MWMSPTSVLKHGLEIVNLDFNGKSSRQRKEYQFKSHFGACPLALCSQWYDLCHDHIPENQLTEKEKAMRGFKRFLIAHWWLYTRPKNATEGSSRFGRCEKLLQGANHWLWIERISLLKHKAIKWPKHFDDPKSEIFLMTVDGIDIKRNRTLTQHSTLPIHKKYYTKKHNCDGLKYELGFAVQSSKLIWMNGPFMAAESDITIFRQSLLNLIPRGKRVIADRGYKGEPLVLSVPSHYDSKALANFKSRARCRHEAFNGRLKAYASLANTFTHGDEKHKIAFEAIAVTCQYSLDAGSILFDV